MDTLTRRKIILGGVALSAAAVSAVYYAKRKKPVPLGFALSDDELAAAHAFLKNNIAFDSHAHPGRTFVKGAHGLAPKLKLYQMLGTFEDKAVADMQAGGLAAAAFAGVADFPLLDLGKHGLAARRAFRPGEAFAYYQVQAKNLQALAARGLVTAIKTPTDLRQAHEKGKPGAWLTFEGGDFLEGKPERVQRAFADGFRSITLVHYHTNALGDIMTAPPVHGGLTEAGVRIVQAMNAAGMVIDTAHASEDTVRGVLNVSRAPVLCSHTHVKGSGAPDVPRFISADLARAIAAQGGLIGLWPAGFGISTLNDLIDRAFALIGIVGPDHVCLGTDMDANYKPVLDSYRKIPWLVGGLLKRGLGEKDTAKLMGGNLLRLWSDVLAQRSTAV